LNGLLNGASKKAEAPTPQQQNQPVQQQSAEAQQPESSFDDNVELSVVPPVS